MKTTQTPDGMDSLAAEVAEVVAAIKEMSKIMRSAGIPEVDLHVETVRNKHLHEIKKWAKRAKSSIENEIEDFQQSQRVKASRERFEVEQEAIEAVVPKKAAKPRKK